MLRKGLMMCIAGILFSISSFGQMADPVQWKFETRKTGDKTYELIATATIEAPWHMYGMYIPEGGPIATRLTLTPSPAFELIGKPVEKTKPIEKKDPNFNMMIGLHSGKAVFVQALKRLTDKPVVIKGVVEYQSCNDRECQLPVDKDFEVSLGNSSQNTAAATASPADTGKSSGLNMAGTSLNLGNTAKKDSMVSIAQGENAGQKSSSGKSMWGFFFLSLLAGLLGILTPCVFPMIPMTVSFFMRGSENRRRSIMNGVVFGLSVILIYTSIGIIVSLTSAGANFANQISTHWIPNTIFFLLFIVFGASFLGMFELILPTSLTNKADQQVDKGGYLAAFFMALTLVLVSFSCTGPIVGALLVEAASGEVLKPTIGMFGFSLAFALPFTLFAIFPSWLKSFPKSGAWLNSVKVVMGFILLAFGMKYFSNIDQAYHLKILGRELYLSIWIVLFFLLGLYFLGKIKFAHDSDLPHLKVPRLMLAIATFSFVVYMIPGLFGAPLSGLSGVIPPKTGMSFDLVNLIGQNGGGSVSAPSQANTLCETPKYANIFEMPYNLKGYFDLEQGLACAKKLNKPVFLDLKGNTCTNCKAMEGEVWSDPAVLQRLRNDFLIIALYADDRTPLPENEWYTSKTDGKVKKTIGAKNADYLVTTFHTNSIPLYVILDTNGKPLVDPVGYSPDKQKFIDFLDKGKAAFEAESTAAGK